MPYPGEDSTSTSAEATEPQIISACLNENDLNYMFDANGTFQPNATVHDQNACQAPELYIQDEDILTDNEIPDPYTPIVEEPSKNRSYAPLLLLGYFLLS